VQEGRPDLYRDRPDERKKLHCKVKLFVCS
jgi:hypothetical protein